MDSVINLETDIRKAFINRETVVAVFFDIEKAYDMLWKEGLLIKLDQIGIGDYLVIRLFKLDLTKPPLQFLQHCANWLVYLVNGLQSLFKLRYQIGGAPQT